MGRQFLERRKSIDPDLLPAGCPSGEGAGALTGTLINDLTQAA